ncbi:MAG: hypothetical protein UX07_C0022G0018, partial [Parcubacteria group bacterium GW2011_GWA2_45_30]
MLGLRVAQKFVRPLARPPPER